MELTLFRVRHPGKPRWIKFVDVYLILLYRQNFKLSGHLTLVSLLNQNDEVTMTKE